MSQQSETVPESTKDEPYSNNNSNLITYKLIKRWCNENKDNKALKQIKYALSHNDGTFAKQQLSLIQLEQRFINLLDNAFRDKCLNIEDVSKYFSKMSNRGIKKKWLYDNF